MAMARQGVLTLFPSGPLVSPSTSRVRICSPSSASTASSATSSRRIMDSFSCLPRAQLSSRASRGSIKERTPPTKLGHSRCFDDAVGLLGGAPVLPKLVVLDLDFTVWPFYCWLFQSWELWPDFSYSNDLQLGALDLFTVECSFPSPSKAVDDIDKILLSAQHWASGRLWDLKTPPTVYPEAIDIIRALSTHEVELAIASRAPSATVAKSCLEKLSISHYFSSMEIYFTVYSKTKHFAALQEQTGVPYNSMLFFDDEDKHIKTAAKLGVPGVLVTKGLNLKSLEKGLKVLASRNR